MAERRENRGISGGGSGSEEGLELDVFSWLLDTAGGEVCGARRAEPVMRGEGPKCGAAEMVRVVTTITNHCSASSRAGNGLPAVAARGCLQQCLTRPNNQGISFPKRGRKGKSVFIVIAHSVTSP